MPDSAPILPYAAPTHRMPVFPAVLLIIWSILDFLAGAFFLSLVFDPHYNLLCGLFLIFGIPFIIWGVVTLALSIRILKSDLSALHFATRMTVLVEIATWIVCAFFLAFVIFNLSTDTKIPWGWIFPTVVVLPLALALTFTHIVLRRAARRFVSSLIP